MDRIGFVAIVTAHLPLSPLPTVIQDAVRLDCQLFNHSLTHALSRAVVSRLVSPVVFRVFLAWMWFILRSSSVNCHFMPFLWLTRVFAWLWFMILLVSTGNGWITIDHRWTFVLNPSTRRQGLEWPCPVSPT